MTQSQINDAKPQYSVKEIISNDDEAYFFVYSWILTLPVILYKLQWWYVVCDIYVINVKVTLQVFIFIAVPRWSVETALSKTSICALPIL